MLRNTRLHGNTGKGKFERGASTNLSVEEDAQGHKSFQMEAYGGN